MLPLTLIFRLTDYWYQLSTGARDNIIGGLIVTLVVAAVGLLWRFGGKLLVLSKQMDPKPGAVPAAPAQEVKVKVEVVPATPVPVSEPVKLPSPVTTLVIPRRPAVGFVARRDSEGRNIVERLREELTPEKNQLVVLHGPGGVGKTTLAAETARALTRVFGGSIAWIRADGRQTFALSTLLDEIATQFGREDLRQLGAEQKVDAVVALLAAEKSLVVLDNFETIGADEQTRCIEFLSQRATCPALLTSRQRIGSARNITIPAMDSEEAEEFLQLLIADTSDKSVFAQLDLERVKQVSERNPLVMQWVIAQIDLAQEADTVLKELTRGGGDAARRVFDRSVELEHLGDDGRAALLALSLFVPDASRESLAETSGFGADLKRLNEAVKRMASLSLVKTTAGGSRLIIEGLTRELARARLTKPRDELFPSIQQAREIQQRFVAYFLRYAQAHAQPAPEDFDALESERHNLFNAMDLAFQLQDWSGVMKLMHAINFDGANGYLSVRGHWEEAIQKGEQVLKAARSSGNDWQIYHFGHSVAIMYHRRGEFDKARELYADSLQLVETIGDEIAIARSLHDMAILAHDQGDLEEAWRLYHRSLEIKRKLGDERLIATTLNQLGKLARTKKDLPEARKLFNESLEIGRRLGLQRVVADNLAGLGRLAHEEGDLAEARRLVTESLEISKRFGDQDPIAYESNMLGLLEEAEGNLAESARLFREAIKIFEYLGSPDADMAQRNLKRVVSKTAGTGTPRTIMP